MNQKVDEKGEKNLKKFKKIIKSIAEKQVSLNFSEMEMVKYNFYLRKQRLYKI